jgi:hypothetical protein
MEAASAPVSPINKETAHDPTHPASSATRRDLGCVLILVAPRFLNYVVAAYLILVGILGFGLIR